MLDEIINELGENYRIGSNYNSNDDSILYTILEEVTSDALTISNRANTEQNKMLLKPEIKACVKGLYLQRGAEGLKNLSERGTISAFNDCMEKMRNDIIKNGKRQCY